MILRPAVIIAANTEPFPGWIDAMTAASPMTLLFCSGLLRRAETDFNIRADLIPVDLVANGIIIGTVD